MKIKKGDIVGRKSYGKDILFVVERIINQTNSKAIAILKGLNIRIQADSFLDDLEIIDKKTLQEAQEKVEKRFIQTINKCAKGQDESKQECLKRSNKIVYTGRILHLDGDKRYAEKSSLFYRKMGLRAVVRSVPESRQPAVVSGLIERYKPEQDILIYIIIEIQNILYNL